MANTRLITTFLSYTPSATSEDASFLAANLEGAAILKDRLKARH